jgi:adenylate kinase
MLGSAPFRPREDLGRILPKPLAPSLELLPPSTPAGLDLVLLGGPGSGKGTQAAQLSARLRLPHVATGNLFRENLRQQTELGRVARNYMDRGELVPDEVTDAMVEQRLALPDTGEGFILDGFPRSVAQAHALAEILGRLRRGLAAVLYIRVSDAAIVARLSARLVCRKCEASYHLHFQPPRQPGRCDICAGELYQRADDNPDTVRARLVTFHRQTEPLIAFYAAAGLLRTIAGEGAPAAITDACLTALGQAANDRIGPRPDGRGV